MEKLPAIYIITNKARTVLYVGVTSNLPERIAKHKQGYYEGFAKKYNCTDLVYYEVCDDMESAILREKQIKKYRREKKNNLINSMNIEWLDLYETIL